MLTTPSLKPCDASKLEVAAAKAAAAAAGAAAAAAAALVSAVWHGNDY